MHELMDAGLFRLRRDRVFWGCLAILLLLSAAVTALGARQCRTLAAEGYAMNLTGPCFRVLPAGQVCIALFIGLYLGTDHSEGALRNRLVTGHSRREVYLSQLGVTATAALAFTAAWLVGSGAVALFHREFWQLKVGATLCYILVAAGSALALAALLTIMGMLTEKKSTAAVAAILLVVGLLLAATWLYSRLQEPEMESGLIITAAGMEWGEPTPNPRYVSGVLRQICEALLTATPTGQVVLLGDLAVAHPAGSLLSSTGIILVTTLAGTALFGKKDLK